MASNCGASLAKLRNFSNWKSGLAPPDSLLLLYSLRISKPNLNAWVRYTSEKMSQNSKVFCARMPGVLPPRSAPRARQHPNPGISKSNTLKRGIPKFVFVEEATWSKDQRVKFARASLSSVVEIVQFQLPVSTQFSGLKVRSSRGRLPPWMSFRRV